MEINTLFSVFIALGTGLGLYQVFRQAPPQQAIRCLDASVFLLFCAIIGARSSYVGLNLSYYLDNPLEAFLINQGGLVWEGAIGGVVLALPFTARDFELPAAVLADSVAQLIPPLGVAAWLGCWMAGCGCAAAVSPSYWWAIPSPDATGLAAARFPLQPAAALVLMMECLLVESFTGRKSRSGLLAGRFGLALGLNLLLFSFYTVDPAPLHPFGWPLSIVGPAVLILISLAWLLFVRLTGRQASIPVTSPEERPVQSRTLKSKSPSPK